MPEPGMHREDPLCASLEVTGPRVGQAGLGFPTPEESHGTAL